jgi:hypothetical protein
MPIFEGHHNDGLFNRSAAVNRAAGLAGEWDVAVIIDADVICDAERVKQAVELAHRTGQARPSARRPEGPDPAGSRPGHGRVRRALGPLRAHVYDRERAWCLASSSCHAGCGTTVGGFDEEFRGWGYEDTAFAAAAETFGVASIRMPGEVWHFWHPTAT